MRIYFSIVTRRVPHEQGGELVALDWDTKRVLARIPMRATDPDVTDLNPRGGARGGRGILRRGDRLFAANYHTLEIFDPDLRRLGRVSHPLFAGIHELCDGDNGAIWAACTSLDAAIAIDEHGQRLDSFWPRENPTLQRRFGLVPATLDKNADQRLAFVDKSGDKVDDPHHTHLNAVARRDGELFVFLNRLGVIFNVTRDRIEVDDLQAEGSHNLVSDGRRWLISDSRGKGVRIYADGELVRRIDFLEHPRIKAIHDAAREANPEQRVLFVRGMQLVGNRLFVGFSPATIVEFEYSSGTLVDLFQYSTRVKDCVHGLLAWT